MPEELPTNKALDNNKNTSRLDMPAADKKSKAKKRMKRVARILRDAAARAVASIALEHLFEFILEII